MLFTPDSRAPVLIKAEQLDYDQEQGIVTATSRVEVIQNDHVLICDRMEYVESLDEVRAYGNVSLLQPNGDIIFANEMTLRNGMNQGSLETVSARLKDNSLLAATKAEQLDADTYRLENAVYSPCSLCKGGEKQPHPLWQLTAKEAVLDQKAERVSYRHNMMEIYGVPVFYTPFFSHPSPDAKRKTGFLSPKYGNNSKFGIFAETPFYWNIAPNMDAHITPVLYSDEQPLLKGKFRHLTSYGQYELSGSITNPYRIDDNENRIGGFETRGHIDGNGHFVFNDNWNAGFYGKRSTDDTYLGRYRFSDEDRLRSEAYTYRIHDNNYFRMRTLSFQGLRVRDDPRTTPLIIPKAEAHFETLLPRSHIRTGLDLNQLYLHTDDATSYERLSASSFVERQFITRGGHLWLLRGGLRTDGYYIQSNDLNVPGNEYGDSFTGRAIPDIEAIWSYPLESRLGKNIFFLEPTVQTIISPYGGNPDDIPNEDSQDIEISNDNLFTKNRFNGLDQVESGPRVNYGIKASLYTDSFANYEALLGQSYRTKQSELFSETTGLDNYFSDYVGRFRVNVPGLTDLAYHFRMDQEELRMMKEEIIGSLYLSPLTFSASYVSLNKSDITENEGRKSEIAGGVALQMPDNWSLAVGGRRNLSQGGGFTNANLSLVHRGDCVNLTFTANRDLTTDRDISESTQFIFNVQLKNLN